MRTPGPWLSVVTVVKDDLSGFERTRSSLAGQVLNDVEWVVVDSSTDQARVESLARLPGATIRYQWTPPSGVYGAMNIALGACTGHHTWFINAGDEVARGNTLGALRAASSGDPLWLIGQVAFIDARGHRTVPAPFDYAEEKRHLFARGRFAPHQGTLVRTTWLTDHSGFDTTYQIAADYQASLRLSLEEDPVVIDAVIAEFRYGGLSSTRWKDALDEFHRARIEVLHPTGFAAVMEGAHTTGQAMRSRAARLLKRA